MQNFNPRGVLTSHTHNDGELRHFHISQILAFLSSSSLDTVTLSTTETTQETSHSLFHIFSTYVWIFLNVNRANIMPQL